MEEPSECFYPAPYYRNHSVHKVLDDIQSTFSAKFQSPIVEWTPSAITATVTHNIQTLTNLTRNIQDDLATNRLNHLGSCIERLQQFNAYTMRWLVRTLNSLYESNRVLLKGKGINQDRNHNQCKVCFRRLEEVRLSAIRDKLQSMNNVHFQTPPDVREIYEQHQQLNFERAPNFDFIISELIMRRDTMMTLNNDKTVFVLEDFLKSMLKQDYNLEPDSNDSYLLAQFRNGKQIISKLYSQLSTNVKDLAKKDVMPLVLKLAQELSFAEMDKRQRGMKSSAVQTIPEPQPQHSMRSIVKRNSSPVHEERKSQHKEHRNSSTSSVDEHAESIPRHSIQQGAQGHRLSSFKFKKFPSHNLKNIRISNISSEGQFSPRLQLKQIGIQTQVSDIDPLRFKQQAIQTTDMKQFMGFHIPLPNNHSFNQDHALLSAIMKDASKESVKEEEAEEEALDCTIDGDIEKQNKIVTQRPLEKVKKVVKKVKDSTKSKEKTQKKVMKSNYSEKKGSKFQQKVKRQPIKRKSIRQKRLATEPSQTITSSNLEEFHKFQKQRNQLAKINQLMTKKYYRKQVSVSNQRTDSQALQMPNQVVKQVIRIEQKSIDQDPSYRNSTQETKITKLPIQVQAVSLQAPPSLTFDTFLYETVGRIRKSFCSQEFARKIAQLLVFAKSHKDWIERVDLVRILEKIHNSKLKAHRPQLKPNSDHLNIPAQGKQKAKQKSSLAFGFQSQTLRMNKSQIESLFKTSTIQKSYISNNPSQFTLHRQSGIRLPNLGRVLTESAEGPTISSSEKKPATTNLIKSDQSDPSANTNLIHQKLKTLRASRNMFALEDLDIFGGLAGAYQFQIIFTKNSIKKRSALADSQSLPLCKHICRLVHSHLQNLRHSSRARYQCVKSFLRFPYQTVCNDFVSLEANQHISLASLEETIGAVLKLHKQCNEGDICGHIESFLLKIGLTIDTFENAERNLNSLGEQ